MYFLIIIYLYYYYLSQDTGLKKHSTLYKKMTVLPLMLIINGLNKL